MPTYDYYCVGCTWQGERIAQIISRDCVACPECGALLSRRLSAPMFKIWGKVTPGGGMDRFTADMLGIPLKELPEGLKTNPKTGESAAK